MGLVRTLTTAALGLAAFAAPIALAGGGGGGADGIPTRVVIDDYQGNAKQVLVAGHLEARRKACRKGRTVLVIGRDYETSDTRVFGRDQTGRLGRFQVREPIPFSEDFIHALAKRKRLRSGRVCKADASPALSAAGRR